MKIAVVFGFFVTQFALAQVQVDLSQTGRYIKQAISDFHSVQCSFEATTEESPVSGRPLTHLSVWFKDVTEQGKKISYSGSLMHLDPDSLQKVMTSTENASFTTFDSKRVTLEVLGKTRIVQVQPEFEGEWLQKRGLSFHVSLVFIDGEINEVTFKYWKNRGILKGKELVFEDECVF